MKPLQPHQERVVAEQKDLAERHTKLVAFVGTDAFNALPSDERGDLWHQGRVMGELNTILCRRLARWGVVAHRP